MKIRVSRLELIKMISRVQGVVAAKPTLPILANILVAAADQQLRLQASDLTVSIQSYGAAQIEAEGAIALPARRFFQLVRELQAPQIELRSEDSAHAILSAGPATFKLHGMRSSDFPPFPASDGPQIVQMAGQQLKEALQRSAFAAAREDHRQVLSAVLMETGHQISTWSGTDGKRLARVEIPLRNAPVSRAIIPLKGVEEMIKTLDGEEQRVTLSSNPGTLALDSSQVLIIIKLLAGEYPDVTRVIPQQPPHVIPLHREELIALLRQVTLFTSASSAAVRFTFAASELQLTAASSTIGEGKVSMPVDYRGERLEIAFNPTYVLDVLRHSRDAIVSLAISDSYNPGLITDSSPAKCVIMPMRLG